MFRLKVLGRRELCFDCVPALAGPLGFSAVTEGVKETREGTGCFWRSERGGAPVSPSAVGQRLAVATVALAWRRTRAFISRRSSRVAKAVDVFLLNERSLSPRSAVTACRSLTVRSLCIRNFANPCQWARVKRSWRTWPLCGLGKSPSKTGIAH